MKKLLIALTVTLGLAGVFEGSRRIAAYMIDDAIAEGVADAGVTPPLAHETMPDPLQHPDETVKIVYESSKRDALWATAGLIVFLLSLGASNLAKADSKFGFLKRGRWPAILGAATALSGSVVDYGMGQVTFMAVIYAAITAATALLSPRHVPKDS